MSQMREDTDSNQLQKFSQYRQELGRWLRSLQGRNDIRIGIWGTSGAGKTTYLARLYDAIALSDDWTIQADREAAAFVDAHLTQIESGKFPERTPKQTREPLKIFSYIITSKKNAQKQRQPLIGSGRIILNFVDAAGEFYEKVSLNEDGKAKVTSKDGNDVDIVDYLVSCDGILFLLDPVRSQEDGDAYSALLRRLFLKFQNLARERQPDLTHLEHYVAFGVTKIDRREIWTRAVESLESHELAKDILGAKIFNQLKTFYWIEPDAVRRKQEKEDPSKRGKINRCDFFSIAAIGRYWDDTAGEWRESVIYPDREAPKNQATEMPPTPASTSGSRSNRGFSGYDPRLTYDSQFNELPSPSLSTPEQNTSWDGNSSQSWGDDDATSTSKQGIDEVARIKRGVDFEATGVLEPIEWLIQGIQNCPPKRLY
jgi:hypothetical protein